MTTNEDHQMTDKTDVYMQQYSAMLLSELQRIHERLDRIEQSAGALATRGELQETHQRIVSLEDRCRHLENWQAKVFGVGLAINGALAIVATALAILGYVK